MLFRFRELPVGGGASCLGCASAKGERGKKHPKIRAWTEKKKRTKDLLTFFFGGKKGKKMTKMPHRGDEGGKRGMAPSTRHYCIALGGERGKAPKIPEIYTKLS